MAITNPGIPESVTVTGDVMEKNISGVVSGGGAVIRCSRVAFRPASRATERGGTPPGSFVETTTVIFVPAGALLLGSVIVSLNTPTFGSGRGTPTLDNGSEVEADCGAELVGCEIGAKFGVFDPELHP